VNWERPPSRYDIHTKTATQGKMTTGGKQQWKHTRMEQPMGRSGDNNIIISLVSRNIVVSKSKITLQNTEPVKYKIKRDSRRERNTMSMNYT